MIAHEPKSVGDDLALTELAPAKINLSLRVLGRRADGYHALESIVAFAEIGDLVTWAPAEREAVRALEGAPPARLAEASSLLVEGPFASAIEGENLVERALRAVSARYAGLHLGRFGIDKRLPVAAGLGGGSADTAAVLRLLGRIHREVDPVFMAALAPTLGADVPVCLLSRPARMTGIGQHLEPLGAMPAVDVVLVNAMQPVPVDKTTRIFRALGAPPFVETDAPEALPLPATGTLADLVALVASVGNDLARPALAVLPGADAALAALAGSPGCLVAALSGAGPTAFGLFPDQASATASARAIARAEPGWWVVASRLAGTRGVSGRPVGSRA